MKKRIMIRRRGASDENLSIARSKREQGQGSASPPECRVSAEVSGLPSSRQGTEQINNPQGSGPIEDGHPARPVRMIEDGIMGALNIDIEEDGDAERQEEKEDDNRAAGALVHRLEYVELAPLLSSRSRPWRLPAWA